MYQHLKTMTREEIVEELAESIFQYSSTLDEMPLNTNWLCDTIHAEVSELVVAKIKSRTIVRGRQFDEIFFNVDRKEIKDWANKGLGVPTYSPATKQAVEQRDDD